MCLILLAIDMHPRYRLVIAANRDEYHDRPTAPLAWWSQAPGVLAGRDLRSGGTWLGIDRSGRIAAVTNFREAGRHDPTAPSRGALVTRFLTSRLDAPAYLEVMGDELTAYNGVNLLVGDAGQLFCRCNRGPAAPIALTAGIWGLSNHLLDSNWPKVARGKRLLGLVLGDTEGDELVPRLLALLADRTVAPDEELPDTGIGLDLERLLAPIFIDGESYGTRSSHLILVGREGRVTCVEQTYQRGQPQAEPISVRFSIDG